MQFMVSRRLVSIGGVDPPYRQKTKKKKKTKKKNKKKKQKKTRVATAVAYILCLVR